jgi:PEP-CTERM motif
MKRSACALALASLAASASAVTLVATPLVGSISANPGASFNPPAIPGFTAANGFIGQLEVTGGLANVVYTFLGKEAAFSNSFVDAGGSPGSIADTAPRLTAATQFGVTGLLNFGFQTGGTTTVKNGFAGNAEPTFGIFAGQRSGYQYILGYNDAGANNDGDYDDMVIGVNVTAAIPEPETYALLLAGLGAVAFVVRRRRQKD